MTDDSQEDQGPAPQGLGNGLLVSLEDAVPIVDEEPSDLSDAEDDTPEGPDASDLPEDVRDGDVGQFEPEEN